MCALLPNGSYFMPYWKFHWTSLLLQQDKFLDAHTCPQNVCALLKKTYWIVEVSVQVGWKFMCVCVNVYVCIGCGAGIHLLALMSYWAAFHIWTVWCSETAVKKRRATDFTIFIFSTTPTFSPLPEFSLLWTLGVEFEYFVLYKGNTNCGLLTFF